MQNDGKVGPGYRTSTELAMHSPLTRLPVILLQVHDKAAQQLKYELQVLFDNADETLFAMADKARSDAEQSLYFEAMRDVRLKRKNIERSFLERLFFAFLKLTQPDTSESALQDPVPTQSAFSLVIVDSERDQAINAMVTQVLARDQLDLCHLTTRLNTLSWVTLNEHTNPLGPAMLCEYFLQAERDQGVDLKVKLIMLQLFEKYLLSQTSRLYADANQLLVATGVLPEISTGIACCSSSKAGHQHESVVAGEDVNQLVGKLFDYISRDRNLAPPLKKLMGQLQEPMLKIAQLDPHFFSSDSHPARSLLNVMADAAVGWDDSVGVRNLKRPILVSRRVGGPIHTVATVELGVELPSSFKGTHMSRFVEALENWKEDLSYTSMKTLLEDIKQRLHARKAQLIFAFPFLRHKATDIFVVCVGIGVNRSIGQCVLVNEVINKL